MKKYLSLLVFVLSVFSAKGQLHYGVVWPVLRSASDVDSNVAVYCKEHVQQVVDSVFFKPSGTPRQLEEIHKSRLDDKGRVIVFEKKIISAAVREIWNYAYDNAGVIYQMEYIHLKDEDTIDNWIYKALKTDDLKRPLLLHKKWKRRNTSMPASSEFSNRVLWDYVGTEAAKQYSSKSISDDYYIYSYFPSGEFCITAVSLAGYDTLSVNSLAYTADGGFLERIYTYYSPNGRKGTIVWKAVNLRITLVETITWRGDSIFEYTTYHGQLDEYAGGIKAYRKENNDSSLLCTFIFKSGSVTVLRPGMEDVKTDELWNAWSPNSISYNKPEKPISIVKSMQIPQMTTTAYAFSSPNDTYYVMTNSKGLRVFYKKGNVEKMRVYVYRDTRKGRRNSNVPKFTITSND
ncbi:MAG: hypothetical protein IM638_01685 [Bacteroidetes bacterium]|nr:hypothetical protein [Bacteroidota bacterium]